MLPLQNFAATVVAEIIRRQPASKERTAFAWSLAVGPALSRATTVELVDDILHVRSRDARWAAELQRARDVVLGRLQQLLGVEAIRDVRIVRE